MKKINNLELDLKKCLATLAATVTIFTMGGCAKEVVKEEVVETPTVTQPKEETPEEVVVDPNAPLFDIQDEEVFNQKVDELYEKTKGISTTYSDIDLNINSKDEAAFLLAMMNIDDLSKEEIKHIINFKNDSNCDNIDFFKVYVIGVTEYNINNPDKFINLSDYIVSEENRTRTVNTEKIVKSYAQTHQFSDEEIKFLCDLVTDIVNDIDTESINSILYMVDYCMYSAMDKNYWVVYGEYTEQLDPPYEIYKTHALDQVIKENNDDFSYSISKY